LLDDCVSARFLFAENIELHGRDAGLYEGDMRLTIDQALMIESGEVRGSIKTGKWPEAELAYEIDPSLSSQSRAMAVIQSAMREWEQKTYVRFKKRTTETAYVSFFKGSGCWSYVGRTGRKQQLSLASGCWYHGIVIHEIGHALGFYHEQSRPDRDQHVTILWENIREANKHNFKKYSTSIIDSHQTPYDYGSIMHYSSRAFSKNGKPTIAVANGATIGQRKGLSPIDAKQMSRRYFCQSGLEPMTLLGSTPSRGTGPSADHSGSGKYIYIETSHPRKANEKAIINFSGYSGGSACLAFYYHMYGDNVNQLNVYLGSSKVFAKAGNQGNEWKKAQVSINGGGNVLMQFGVTNFLRKNERMDFFETLQIVFEGIRGSGWQGDIAIDDFSLTVGSCEEGIPDPPGPTTPPPPGNCGLKPSVRIVGGTVAAQNSWPWQAMLRTTSGFPFCGGSLIAPQWVASAAHCVRGKSPSSLMIRLGAHRRIGRVGTEQDFKVVKIISHASYHNPVRYSYDIALIKLEKPANLNKAVGLVCVPDGNSPAMPIDNLSKKCWITGWGRLASGGATPEKLMQASVPLVSKSRKFHLAMFEVYLDCEIARCLKGYPNMIHDSMLCAGLDKGGVDACQGDSGGPLVCQYNGRWFLEGATSWGHGCAGPMKYGVYAKVRYVKSWIDQIMKSN
ncbi:hypothetical protein pdam_00001722, partial [Pocillopora damicornis]